jgi:hypothetical protein
MVAGCSAARDHPGQASRRDSVSSSRFRAWPSSPPRPALPATAGRSFALYWAFTVPEAAAGGRTMSGATWTRPLPLT